MAGAAREGAGPRRLLTVLQLATGYLQKKGVPQARLDAEVLLASVLECPRIQLYVQYDRILTPEEIARYRELTGRRGRREPVAYLVGRKEFCGLPFQVTPAVLIPRPETELLVDLASGWASQGGPDQALVAADVGTGSGAIAVALARRHPRAEVYATDAFAEALAVAQQNAASLGVTQRVHFLRGNLAEPLLAQGLAGRVDILLSNPPYVSSSEFANLAPELAYEPRPALDGGLDGMKYYGPLWEQAARLVCTGGRVAFEVSPMIAEKVADLAKASEAWTEVSLHKDLAGHWRAVSARRT